jgi:spermidine synthase
MTKKPQKTQKPQPPAEVVELPPQPFLFLLLILFAASGCAALIYEVVWYQLLQLVIGSTAISLGVLLATFMGGLCLGSLLLPRLAAARSRHPLRVLAIIEAGIGACGILVLNAMPLVDRVYAFAVAHGFPSLPLRAVVGAICLLPPTLLMGASLPIVARWVQASPQGVSWMGFFYGGNTVGAVLGGLLAGFCLLRLYDMAVATYVAAALNGSVALAAFVLAQRKPEFVSREATADSPGAAPRGAWPVYLTIALSGACALGAEVVWTRLLGLLLGATVYTFSIILAVFLAGLGIGSGVGSYLSRTLRPREALGYCQLLLAAAVAWTAYMLAEALPFWPINPALSWGPWYTFQLDLLRAILALLPGPLLWGASFPLALAAVASPENDPGRLVGRVYAANTSGAILGALAFSMFLIPEMGTRDSQRVLLLLSALSALVVLVPVIWARRKLTAWILLMVAVTLACFLAVRVVPVPPDLIAYGRNIMISAPRSQAYYVGEGLNSSIAITRWDDSAIQFHVSGKVEASTEIYDMRLQRMLGHMPALLHPAARSVLIVGFGAGVTAGSFVVHPDIQRIVICELEPLIPPVATRYFGRENYNVLNDPRTQMVYDDARHFVMTTPEKFDIITSDPIHPWVKGSATLYSKEYFEMVKQHLNPGGIVTQWVPLYESDARTVKSEIATFFSVFPGGTVWTNEIEGGGYDLFLLGQAAPSRIDLDQLEQRLSSPAYAPVARSLNEVGFGTLQGILSIYAGRDADLRPWLQGAAINADANLRLQYLAGLARDLKLGNSIYREMMAYRRFPADLFTGSEERVSRVRQALGMP